MADHEDDKEQQDSNMCLIPHRRDDNISIHNNRDGSDPLIKGNSVVVDTGKGKGNEDDGDGDRRETKIRFAICDVEEGDDKADTNGGEMTSTTKPPVVFQK